MDGKRGALVPIEWDSVHPAAAPCITFEAVYATPAGPVVAPRPLADLRVHSHTILQS